MATAVATASAPVYMFNLAFLAIFTTGTAIRATTAGLIPWKTFMTDSLWL